MNDDEAKIAEFLSRGGKVTKCPPGPSENIVYRNGPRFRSRAKVSREDAPAETPKPAEG